MTDKERIIKYIMDNLLFDVIPPRTFNGICLTTDKRSIVFSEEIDLVIAYGGKKSIVKNKEMATEIYRRALDLIIK